MTSALDRLLLFQQFVEYPKILFRKRVLFLVQSCYLKLLLSSSNLSLSLVTPFDEPCRNFIVNGVFGMRPPTIFPSFITWGLPIFSF